LQSSRVVVPDPDKEDFSDREFPMSQNDYQRIVNVAYRETGIKLTSSKKNMIYGRLARILRKQSFLNFSTYCDELDREGSEYLHDFINAITTNLTSFFREIHHFDSLKEEVIPDLIKANAATKKLRIWSAGCSTGEEPHSIAMTLSEIPQLRNWDVKILATDLDSNVVAHGQRGVYDDERVGKVPEQYEKYLTKIAGTDTWQIADSVRNLIRFRQLNLLKDWPMKGKFDVIFCRNVIIYFDVQTQKTLFDRYANILQPQGTLFIGHSENLNNVSDRFQLQKRTTYRKVR
jgi:chemotaxis protein methyltransferase CheR